ncbi:MAG TPA: SpoIIE family protein phosphatase [Terriglobia bacterium]|nr:SpoIIE family protein phosphatase [Terriglobia bacterium]
MTILSRFTRVQRIALPLFVVLVLARILAAVLGAPVPFRVGIPLFLLELVLALILARPLIRKFLWRVRRRILLNYFLIGVLPITLIAIFVTFAFNLVLSQTANYLLHVELDRRIDQLLTTAQRISDDVTIHGESSATIPMGEKAIIRTGVHSPPEFPAWSTPGFKGVLLNKDGVRFLAAHGSARNGRQLTEAFVYQELDNKLLSELLPGLASAYVVEGTQVRVTIGRRSAPANANIVLDSENIAPAPSPHGFWDIVIESASPLNVQSMADGKSHEEAIGLVTYMSALLRRLFSTLGPVAVILGLILLVIAVVFIVVEVVAILFSIKLTRTITLAVHDLDLGTKAVQAGDFAHRIPVRSTEQLSELASSFNSMTSRIQKLIAEVKDKEKLEAELEIARQVQAQLFPKNVPRLKTMEMAGLCLPARVVGGDYYDFIAIQPDSTAIIIGDISGKGISAALLMASVQSSLHAQLSMAESGGVSTATLCTRLNQQLYDNTPPEKYATFFCSVYEESSGRLTYTNAGHLAPIVIRGSNVIRLDSNSTVVGLLPNYPYGEEPFELQSGDLLLAFTDGITESENKESEQYGEERLIELLMRNRDKPLDEILRIISETVRSWAFDLDGQDDTTLIVVRKL